jgi:hypothetical protein
MYIKLALDKLNVCELSAAFAAANNYDFHQMWDNCQYAGWYLWLQRKLRINPEQTANIIIAISNKYPVPDNHFVDDFVNKAKDFISGKDSKLDVEPYEAQYVAYTAQKMYGDEVLDLVRSMMYYGSLQEALESFGKNIKSK